MFLEISWQFACSCMYFGDFYPFGFLVASNPVILWQKYWPLPQINLRNFIIAMVSLSMYFFSYFILTVNGLKKFYKRERRNIIIVSSKDRIYQMNSKHLLKKSVKNNEKQSIFTPHTNKCIVHKCNTR